MRFESPWALLLLLVLPAVAYLHARRRGRPSLRFSSVAPVAAAGASLRHRLAFVPGALRFLALALFVVALARPQQGHERVRDVTSGIAIEMVVDRSSSMSEELAFEGRRVTRLDAVKKVFREFVFGGPGGLEGRPNDLIGLVAFARYPDTVCPLTLGHDALDDFLDTVNLVRRKAEDGTAIGDALALAAARLEKAEAVISRQHAQGKDDYEIKSKVIILLTDGRWNTGKRSPVEAAKLASEWGIRIYTVGVGGRSAGRIQTPFGAFQLPGRGDLDEGTLETVAAATEGRFFLAEDAGDLREVYETIDQLEKSEIESVRYLDYKERFAPFVLAGLALLFGEVLLRATWLRRLP